MMKESQNDHIREYLNYYLKLAHPPQYAVLINGCWGSGKTWVIKDYFARIDAGHNNHLYVSLYGFRSTSEIDSAFFAQLHPKLSSNGMTIAAKIVGSAINTGANMILNSELIKDDAGAALQSCLTNTEGRTLVFDDLERCAIPLSDILGYINYFVEHGGYKCIIIANEDEIEGGGPAKNDEYSRIKEKLIGKSIAVVPDFENATTAFIANVGPPSAKVFLEQNIHVVYEIYRLSEYNNLRAIRHAILEFARIFDDLDIQHAKNTDAARCLLRQHFVYSLEYRCGDLKLDSIGEIKMAYLSRLVKSMSNNGDGDDEVKLEPTLSEKYPPAELDIPIVQEDFWKHFYEYGTVDRTALNESVSDSRFYYDQNTPPWRRLLDLWSLSNEQFDKVLSKVRAEFEAREYTDVNIVKHISGNLMALAEKNLISESVSDILSATKEYVIHLRDSGALTSNVDNFGHIFDEDHYAGVGFWGAGIPEFVELRQYIVKSTAEALIAAMPRAGEDLLDEMQSDIGLFVRRLTLSNSEDNKYYNKPVLAHIRPAAFVDRLFELNRSDWRAVASVFRKRYEHLTFSESLVDELPWLQDVSKLLQQRQKSSLGTLDEFRILDLLKYLQPNIERLNKIDCHNDKDEPNEQE